MTDHPVRSRHLLLSVVLSQSFRSAAVAGLLFVALASGGCAEHKRATLPWPTASVVHPRIPEVAAMDTDIAEEDAPELRLELPAPVMSFPPATTVRPPRVRTAAPPPVAVEVSKPQSPVAAPSLSAEESSTAQQETNASLAAAEKGLGVAQGKNLNAAQTDMVSKITGFMADARAASAISDWTRAQTLARKAQLLVEELVKSLQ
jgi:hypothetical protein